jgi:hypothetical protein
VQHFIGFISFSLAAKSLTMSAPVDQYTLAAPTQVYVLPCEISGDLADIKSSLDSYDPLAYKFPEWSLPPPFVTEISTLTDIVADSSKKGRTYRGGTSVTAALNVFLKDFPNDLQINLTQGKNTAGYENNEEEKNFPVPTPIAAIEEKLNKLDIEEKKEFGSQEGKDLMDSSDIQLPRAIENNPLQSNIFYVNKLIFASQSPVLAKLIFPSGGGEGQFSQRTASIDHLTLDDISAVNFNAIANYLVSGLITLNDYNFDEIVDFGEKYEISSLTPLFQQFLKHSITLDNCVPKYLEAKRSKSNKMATYLLSIREKLAVLIAQNKLDALEAADVAHIVESETLAVSEVELFRFVMDWSAKQLKKEGKEVTGPAQYELLSTNSIIDKIRFPVFSVTELAAFVSPANLLPQQHLIQLFTYSTVADKSTVNYSLPYPLQRRALAVQQFFADNSLGPVAYGNGISSGAVIPSINHHFVPFKEVTQGKEVSYQSLGCVQQFLNQSPEETRLEDERLQKNPKPIFFGQFGASAATAAAPASGSLFGAAKPTAFGSNLGLGGFGFGTTTTTANTNTGFSTTSLFAPASAAPSFGLFGSGAPLSNANIIPKPFGGFGKN